MLSLCSLCFGQDQYTVEVVKLTDNSVLPFARAVIKLEIFPPGQAATKIIPKATLGEGFNNKTNPKVNKGRMKN